MVPNLLLYIINVIILKPNFLQIQIITKEPPNISGSSEGVNWFTALNRPYPWEKQKQMKIPIYIRKF